MIQDNIMRYIKALSHGAIFLATWNAYTKGRIALEVARKIAPCDRALIHVCLAYLFFTLRTSSQLF